MSVFEKGKCVGRGHYTQPHTQTYKQAYLYRMKTMNHKIYELYCPFFFFSLKNHIINFITELFKEGIYSNTLKKLSIKCYSKVKLTLS